jgi:zinc transport system substrate-binding protein
MKRTLATVFVLFVFASAIAVVFVFYRKSPSDERLKVAATLMPLESIVREIAGERIGTVLMVPPGQSPHTFDPDPGTLRDISEAEIIFKIGLIDDWASSLSRSSGVEEFFVGEGVDIMTPEEVIVIGEEEEEEDGDPHYWLSIKNGKMIARNVAEKLSEIDPGGREYYENNLDDFIGRADEADIEIKNILADIPVRKMITFHDAWGYFAKDYDLEIVAVYQPSPGKDPLPMDVKSLVDEARLNGINAFFSEVQYSPAPLMSIGESEGITVIALDPLGERWSYLESLIDNAEKIKEGLSL